MIDAASWAMRWRMAGDLAALRRVARHRAQLAHEARDAAGELHLARLALFASGRVSRFVGVSQEVHPLAHIQAAVNLHQAGQGDAAARVLVRALRRLETADDDGGGP